jgi:hypothetical protein
VQFKYYENVDYGVMRSTVIQSISSHSLEKYFVYMIANDCCHMVTVVAGKFAAKFAYYVACTG